MLTVYPILIAIAYALLSYRFSVWRTKRELDARSTPLTDPELRRLTANHLSPSRILITE